MIQSLPSECMATIFSFVGGNTHEDLVYRCTNAGKFYQQLALVCCSWKHSIDASLPSLVTNLEIVLEGRTLDYTDSLLEWLERFQVKLSSIKVPILCRKERITLIKILHSFDMNNLKHLSLGKNEWQDPWGAPVYLGKLDSLQQMGDTSLQEWIAKKCTNVTHLDIALDLNGLEQHKPSESLCGMKSIRSLTLTPVYYSCYASAESNHNIDGDDESNTTNSLDLTYITRLVGSLPLLERLELRGACLKGAPDSKLPLVSSSLKVLHGYDFPNHVWISIDRCSHLNPYL